ncbi:MAG: hypothetical protein H7256_07270 [Bdellovibrio sp.]|nr:hypothetical protein [Bdellovibrio sp.]
MKKKSLLLVTKVLIIFVLASAVVVRLAYKLNFEAILIQSLESKTKEGDPVFNKISWFSFEDKDVWMMNQSHHGIATTTGSDLDRLVIVVDKTTSPKNVRFMQLKPGALVWSEELINQRVPYKVSCFMCHSNGPRAIRPGYNGLVKNSFSEKMKIMLLNLKVKTQGQIVENEQHAIEDKDLAVPFRHRSKIENDSLLVKTCTRCHNETGLFARGFLKRQNFLAINFMVNSGFMPPPGFSVTAKEKLQIQRFTEGF